MNLYAELANWPAGSAAVGVIGPAGPLAMAETGSSGALFAWASVTKLLTALTVLDACADGTVDLEENAGPPGATVAHLLSHASGLPLEAGAAIAPPGTRRQYSNYGYEILAEHLAARAGGPFNDELIGRVLGPLAMSRTTVAGSAARDGVGPLEDLMRLAAELLMPQTLGPECIAQASTLIFPGLPGILPGFGRQQHNDWGLGCEIRGSKNPHWTSEQNSPATFGHFGQSGSFLWVDPGAGIACVSLSDTMFGPWAVDAWPKLSSAVLAETTWADM